MSRIPRGALLVAAAILIGCEPAAVTRVESASLAPTKTPSATARPTALQTPAPTPEPTSSGPLQVQPDESITITQAGEDWAVITISKVAVKTKYSGQYYTDTPDSGNVYIEAWVTYEALVDGVDYNPFDWQVFVGGVASDNFTYVANGPEPNLGSGSLPKGRKAEGWVVYEVATTGQVLMSYGQTFGSEPPVFEVVLRNA